MSRIFSSLIQSDFTNGDHGNLEAVIETGGELRHWFRGAGNEWSPGAVIVATGAAGPGCLIQSDFTDGDHGNFEVAVPLYNATGGQDLWHFFHDNSDVALPWQPGQLIAANVAGPGSLIQSDFTSGDHGNFEVIVPLPNETGGQDLWHFFHDNSDVALPWQPGQLIAANVAGPGSLIQSDFTDGDHGNFEVAVPLHNETGGQDLWHFFHDNSDVALPWQRSQLIAANVAGPGSLIQSDFTDGDHGNFEVVVPLPRGNAAQLRHFFRDNVDTSSPWVMGQAVTDSCGGWGCLIRSDFVEEGHGNFEVIVEECTQSVVAYWHPNADVSLPWLRHRVILGEPYPFRLPRTRRIVQLTGEHDRTGWNGSGDPPPAFNRTESTYGIIGTDLGSSFQHQGRTYFLFGDTFRVNQPDDWDALDLIAYTTDPTARAGLKVVFQYEPPRISDGISQRAFEVPLDGVSDGTTMLVFFSTDHSTRDGNELMGRSVLTSSVDGVSFRLLRDVSTFKFINVSVQRQTIDAATAEQIGLPGHTDVLWIWGSGRYRASDVYLAVTPFAELRRSPDDRGPLALRYFAGSRTRTAWSANEEDASALFSNASVGELSVRWNPHVRRWLATFNSDNPRGILLHSAPAPWGPWSQQPVMVFDSFHRANPDDPCSGDGYGTFIHLPKAGVPCDHVQDDMFTPGTFRDSDYGGDYGPYQISNYAEDAGGGASWIYFLLSTWNPYQAMLMTTHLAPSDLERG